MWAKFVTHRNHPLQILGLLGSETTPSNDTQIIFFGLKLDHLLLRFQRQVICFSFVLEGLVGRIGTHKNHPYQIFGVKEVAKPPPVMTY